MPGTILRMTNATGLARSTVERWTNEIHGERKCHVMGWERKPGDMAPIYAMGAGRDVPMPKPFTQAEYSRRFIKRLKEHGEYDRYLAKKRARHTVKLAITGKIIDPLVAGLFGNYRPAAEPMAERASK